jgi:hypothetical protein
MAYEPDLLDMITGNSIVQSNRNDMANNMANKADIQHRILMNGEKDTKNRVALAQLSQKLKDAGNKQATDSLTTLAFGSGKSDPSYQQFTDISKYGGLHPDTPVGLHPEFGAIRHGDIIHHALVRGISPSSLMQELINTGLTPNNPASMADDGAK